MSPTSPRDRPAQQRDPEVVVFDSVTEDGTAAEDGTAPRTRTTTILRRARMRDWPLPSSRTSRARTSSVFQSRTLWNELLVAGLVDELC